MCLYTKKRSVMEIIKIMLYIIDTFLTFNIFKRELNIQSKTINNVKLMTYIEIN